LGKRRNKEGQGNSASWIMTERRTDLQMKRCQNFSVVNIPIIVSGAGNIQHFVDSFTVGKADAALAASVFHFKEIEIKALKTALKNNNIEENRKI
jgi:imidazole glycerol phosphate synthase subunit HisF